MYEYISMRISRLKYLKLHIDKFDAAIYANATIHYNIDRNIAVDYDILHDLTPDCKLFVYNNYEIIILRRFEHDLSFYRRWFVSIFTKIHTYNINSYLYLHIVYFAFDEIVKQKNYLNPFPSISFLIG